MSFYNISVKQKTFSKLRILQTSMIDRETGKVPTWDEVITELFAAYPNIVDQ